MNTSAVVAFARRNGFTVASIPTDYKIVMDMAESMGDAFADYFTAEAVDAAVDRCGGNRDVVVFTFVEGDYDYGSQGHERREDTNLRAIAEEIADYRHGGLKALNDIETYYDLCGWFGDMVSNGGGHLIEIMTQAEADERDAENRRRELEDSAAAVCKRNKVKGGTLAFLDAVQDEISQQRDLRYGMREDGLCCGAGMTADQWYDEYNAIAGDIAHLYDILDWSREQTPLLFAQWQEKRATADVVELQDA